MQLKKDIIINGAGLVGSLLAIYLAKRGHAVRSMNAGRICAYQVQPQDVPSILR